MGSFLGLPSSTVKAYIGVLQEEKPCLSQDSDYQRPAMLKLDLAPLDPVNILTPLDDCGTADESQIKFEGPSHVALEADTSTADANTFASAIHQAAQQSGKY